MLFQNLQASPSHSQWLKRNLRSKRSPSYRSLLALGHLLGAETSEHSSIRLDRLLLRMNNRCREWKIGSKRSRPRFLSLNRRKMSPANKMEELLAASTWVKPKTRRINRSLEIARARLEVSKSEISHNKSQAGSDLLIWLVTVQPLLDLNLQLKFHHLRSSSRAWMK